MGLNVDVYTYFNRVCKKLHKSKFIISQYFKILVAARLLAQLPIVRTKHSTRLF